MSANKDTAKVAGLAVVACAACCAGPIIGFLGAVGLATALGVFLFGATGLAVAGVSGLWWFRRRKRHRSCTASTSTPVTLSAPRMRTDA